MSAIIAPRSMARTPKFTVPATVKLLVDMLPNIVVLMSVAVAPGPMPSWFASPSLIRTSLRADGRRPRTMDWSSRRIRRSTPSGPRRSTPKPKIGACAFVSPLSSGMSSSPRELYPRRPEQLGELLPHLLQQRC